MAKIRPITDQDLRDTYGEVKTPMSLAVSSDSSSVYSDSIFGRAESATGLSDEEGKENLDIYLRTGYIHLAVPVLNPFITGTNAEVLSLILQANVGDIAAGIIYYNTNDREEHLVKDMQSSDLYGDNILLGGEYINYLIDKLDVEEEIKGIFTEMLCKILADSLSGDKSGLSITINRNGRGTRFFEDYCFQASVEYDEAMVLEQFKQSLIKMFDNLNVRLTYLLSLRKSKDVLYGMVMKDLIVLPKGYRAKFQGKYSAITKAYDSIVRRNLELRNLILRSNATLDQVREKYILLVQDIRNLTVEKSNRYDTQYKTLFDLLKGKSGLIRDKMQGGRIDYTGRSVIVVDPDMSLDTIGVPSGIAESIMEYEEIKQFQTDATNKSAIFHSTNRGMRKNLAKKAIEKVYSVAGRQPTLYNLGLRGFKNKVVDGDAIVLNPLVTPAFNADFDGDQMHISVPIGYKARTEVKNLMSVENNIYLPRNGECHIAPRMEILHGLWKASSVEPLQQRTYYYPHGAKDEEGNTLSVYDEVLEGVITGDIKLYDLVQISGALETAGKVAIRACLPDKWKNVRLGITPITYDAKIGEKPVTEGFFKELNKAIELYRKKDFVPTINKLVRLGFAVTNMFPPSIPVLDYPDVSDLIQEFKQKVNDHEKYYNIGLETDAAYSAFYDTAYAELEKAILNRLKEKMPKDSGYMEMISSGARGKMSNIIQMFGMKGRVMKNSYEAFNAIIEKPLVKQLSGLEHFVTAYGGRQGLIDKSIQTYGPGYLSRKMTHTASPMYITCEDCGTSNGMLLDYEFIKQFISATSLTGVDIVDNAAVQDYFVDLIMGRYIVGSDKLIETRAEAIKVYQTYVADISESELKIKDGVKMRSPLTCSNPCCVKCYGINLGTNRLALPGYPAGFNAATSIGEPGTQLTMKNFQNGGVAGVQNLTSSFDTMNSYINMYKLRKDPSQPINYDFISPVDGYVEAISLGDGTKKLNIYDFTEKGKKVMKLRQTVILYEGIELKDYVHKGDSVQKVQGDLDISELMERRSVDYARRYLAVKLFSIFKNEVFVNLKHFEILVASMTFYLCLQGNDYFKPGIFYMAQEYYGHDRKGAEFEMTLKGVGQVPKFRNDVFSTIFMQDIKSGIERSIILSGEDEMKLPITRYSFGLPIEMGSAIDGYLERRK